MKEMRLGKVAVAASALLCATAHAQSSVTLYGLIDESVQYVHNVADPGGKNANRVALYNGNIQGNRWGLRGAEDLGGGVKAVFVLESGFNINNGQLGQGGRLFGRQAYLGLDSANYGRLTVGRQYDPLVDLVAPLTGVTFGGSSFAAPGDIDNNDNNSRVSNSIKVTFPKLYGVQFEGMYALGGTAGQTGSGQTWAVAGAYSVNGLSIGAGYISADNSASNVPRANTPSPWGGTIDGNFGSVVNSGAKTAKGYDIASIALSYLTGPVTLGARYSNARYIPDAASSFRSTEVFNTAAGFMTYNVTSLFAVGGQYNYTHANGPARADYHQVSLGADYLLSKRTDLYLLGVYQHASGNQIGVSPAAATAGDYGYTSAFGSHTQEIASAGIRHKF
ncbi:porin [Paraburkholderia dipogonis]|uniref:Porin n=1 Tax=Paraburkholderia dipogonis TaxID=1211383 RepID=A0A4Y8MK55_9BURK|nr:porin [Paraburkholderia dipogonis]TFE37822.1 porin [Paraburkholderia dipogonis]